MPSISALQTAVIFLLPLVVAAFRLSFLTALLLVAALLVLRWLGVLRGLRGRKNDAELTLVTIGASHFAEKARWCLDRLGLAYSERRAAGTLGAFYLGRTVPVLEFRSGLVRSSIGNSPEILRYLWGRYAAERSADAAFLEPTAERLELETRLDRYGQNLQLWVYYHLLPHKQLLLHAWGADDNSVPVWQRFMLRFLRPVQAAMIRYAFGTSRSRYEKALQHIDALLKELDDRLENCLESRPNSLLGEEVLNFTDLSFAALSSIWLMPEEFAGGRATTLKIGELPAEMQRDIEHFKTAYPAAAAFAARLYAEERSGKRSAETPPGEKS
ncbi:MAG: hypothetical protein AAFX56_04530 [Pseudomonadota bacterium]